MTHALDAELAGEPDHAGKLVHVLAPGHELEHELGPLQPCSPSFKA